MRTTLLSAVSATGAGTAVQFSDAVRATSRSGIVQCIHTGTATTELQGSLDGTNYFTLATFPASGAYAVDLPHWVRGNVTARTSGTITLILERAPA